MEIVKAEVAALPLTGVDGALVSFGSLWADRPAVVVFLRHFGWMFCREQAVQLHRDRARFEAAGARLVFVGNGAPLFARTFVEDYHLDEPVLVDEKRATYKALGLGRVTLATLASPRAILAAARALTSGFVQGRTQGHPFQLGGVLAVKPGGGILYRYRSAFAGDHPKHEAILEALGAPAEAVAEGV